MRISDWSSDVCSSDLQIGQLVGEVGRCLAFEIDRVDDIDRRHRFERRVPLHPGAGYHHLVEQFRGFGWLARGSLLACGFLGKHRHRSEEHTSELQSLMRLSYAVFCLKKKKQIQTS